MRRVHTRRMPFRAVALAQVPGQLWLSSMPGRFEPWADFLIEQRRAGIALVLCLTPREEISVGAPAYHRAIAEGVLPFRWINLPMRNFGLPLDMHAYRDGIDQAAQSLRNGEAVLLH